MIFTIKQEPLAKYKGSENYCKLQQIQNYFPNTIIGGGAARQFFLNEEFGSTDVDIYSSSRREQEYSYHRIIPLDPPAFISANAFNINCCGIKCQLVKCTYTSSVIELFESYDFACCMFAIVGNYIYYTEQAVEDASHKWLNVLTLNRDTLHQRVGKYLKKGYIPKCPLSTEVFLDFIKTSYEQRYDFTNELYTSEALFANYFGVYPEGY